MATARGHITGRLTVIDDEIRKKVLEVLDRPPYYAGPETAAFEMELAAHCGVAHGVAVNSGTSALLVALLACDIGPAHEVIIPANTFVSVPECIMFVGATPVLTDVGPNGNITSEIVERHLTPRTRAIVPVHTFGNPVDMDPIMTLAEVRRLYVIEDGAHALGGRYNGRRVGSLGHVGFFSFGGKSITVCGQAGMAVTSDARLAKNMASRRVHGYASGLGRGGQDSGEGEDLAEQLGLNLRTSEILSAIGRINLRRLDGWNEKRAANAKRYNAALAAARLPVILPTADEAREPGWLHYTIRVPRRDALQSYLSENGVGTSVLYRTPLYRHPAFRQLASSSAAFPITEALAADIITLPSHPWLSADDVDYVVDCITRFYH